MPIRLDSRSADFAKRFADFLATKREVSEEVDAAAAVLVEAPAEGVAADRSVVVSLSRPTLRTGYAKRSTGTEISTSATWTAPARSR